MGPLLVLISISALLWVTIFCWVRNILFVCFATVKEQKEVLSNFVIFFFVLPDSDPGATSIWFMMRGEDHAAAVEYWKSCGGCLDKVWKRERNREREKERKREGSDVLILIFVYIFHRRKTVSCQSIFSRMHLFPCTWCIRKREILSLCHPMVLIKCAIRSVLKESNHSNSFVSCWFTFHVLFSSLHFPLVDFLSLSSLFRAAMSRFLGIDCHRSVQK